MFTPAQSMLAQLAVHLLPVLILHACSSFAELAGRPFLGRIINFCGSAAPSAADSRLVTCAQIPRNLAEYVHRVGRTARAGRKGCAVTLADDRYGCLAVSLSTKILFVAAESPFFSRLSLLKVETS